MLQRRQQQPPIQLANRPPLLGPNRNRDRTRKCHPILMAIPLPVCLLLSLLGAPLVSSLENGLARTPPMGWIGWQRFACETDCNLYPDTCISERLFQKQALKVKETGLRDAGYVYVNIDDCWSETERHQPDERLVANRTRFPAGMAALSKHVHELGLKLGLYGDCGTKTCAGYPAQLRPAGGSNSLEPHPAALVEGGADGSGDFFALDAATLNDWQVDSFKLDGCFIDPFRSESVCPRFSKALLSVSRPILLTCEWPFYLGLYGHAHVNWSLAAESCNLWRYFDDIDDSWLGVLNTIDYTVKHQSTFLQYHGPGHWFDPDQLLLGDFGLSREQSFAQMALWSLWSAPLFMSNDLRIIDQWQLDILKNKHLIDVNQDHLGVLALMVAENKSSETQVFVKPIERKRESLPTGSGCPSFALLYLNRATLGQPSWVSFKLADLLLKVPLELAAERQMSLPEGERGQEINFINCLERLIGSRHKAEPESEQEEADDDQQINKGGPQFKVTDLRDGQVIERFLDLTDNLELLVAPSGVRAVRLDELLA